MAIQEFLDTHHVFTLAQFTQEFPTGVTDRNLLARATQSGNVDIVRRGVYVSKVGQYAHAQADPFDVALAIADDAIFCYMSALQLHGVLHNLVNLTQFYTAHRIPPFSYARLNYRPYRYPKPTPDTQSILTFSGYQYPVTTKEQTLIDCLVHPGLAGGPENLLRSLSSFTYLDRNRLETQSQNLSRNTCAKLGWVLEAKQEEWLVSATFLEHLSKFVGGGPYYFYSSRPPKDDHWVNRWRLYLPYSEQEMIEWLNQ